MRALLLGACLLLSGCWSFPDELLRRDGSVDRGADQNLPQDAPPAETTVDQAFDTTVDLAPDTFRPCMSPCTGTTPICDDGSCRACKDNGECVSEGHGDLCAADGSCPPPGDVAYVDKSNCNTGKGDPGSKTNPHCNINDAVGDPPEPKYILVRPGTYGDTTIDKSHEVYGDPGAIIQPTACDKLKLAGGNGVKILLARFTIKGNVLIDGAGTNATLLYNTIGPSKPISGCVGVNAIAATVVTLVGNVITGHHGGGALLKDLDYSVVNNVFAESGNTGENFGAAKLKALDIKTSYFIHNTVVKNTSKTDKADDAPLRCEADNTPIINTIFWQNTPAIQYGAQCIPHSCEDTQDPKFDPVKAYHLTPGSVSVIGKGATPSEISDIYKNLGAASPYVPQQVLNLCGLDFDGEVRDSSPDIGADELLP
jgi:hypothetical protein